MWSFFFFECGQEREKLLLSSFLSFIRSGSYFLFLLCPTKWMKEKKRWDRRRKTIKHFFHFFFLYNCLQTIRKKKERLCLRASSSFLLFESEHFSAHHQMVALLKEKNERARRSSSLHFPFIISSYNCWLRSLVFFPLEPTIRKKLWKMKVDRF